MAEERMDSALPKLFDNGNDNNYVEWETKASWTLSLWNLWKYIEGPESTLSGTSTGTRWEGTEITFGVTNWDTHLARDEKKLRSSPYARGYFVFYADQC